MTPRHRSHSTKINTILSRWSARLRAHGWPVPPVADLRADLVTALREEREKGYREGYVRGWRSG